MKIHAYIFPRERIAECASKKMRYKNLMPKYFSLFEKRENREMRNVKLQIEFHLKL